MAAPEKMAEHRDRCAATVHFVKNCELTWVKAFERTGEEFGIDWTTAKVSYRKAKHLFVGNGGPGRARKIYESRGAAYTGAFSGLSAGAGTLAVLNASSNALSMEQVLRRLYGKSFPAHSPPWRTVNAALWRHKKAGRIHAKNGLYAIAGIEIADGPLSCLGALQRHDRPKAGAELIGETGKSNFAVYAEMRRHVRDGLVIKNQNPSDHRGVVFALTPAGRAYQGPAPRRKPVFDQPTTVQLCRQELLIAQRKEALLTPAQIVRRLAIGGHARTESAVEKALFVMRGNGEAHRHGQGLYSAAPPRSE